MGEGYTISGKFVEDDEHVHLYRGEHTLCGIACDAFQSGDADSEIRDTSKRVVDCPICVEVILDCRGVRVKP